MMVLYYTRHESGMLHRTKLMKTLEPKEDALNLTAYQKPNAPHLISAPLENRIFLLQTSSTDPFITVSSEETLKRKTKALSVAIA